MKKNNHQQKEENSDSDYFLLANSKEKEKKETPGQNKETPKQNKETPGEENNSGLKLTEKLKNDLLEKIPKFEDDYDDGISRKNFFDESEKSSINDDLKEDPNYEEDDSLSEKGNTIDLTLYLKDPVQFKQSFFKFLDSYIQDTADNVKTYRAPIATASNKKKEAFLKILFIKHLKDANYASDPNIKQIFIEGVSKKLLLKPKVAELLLDYENYDILRQNCYASIFVRTIKRFVLTLKAKKITSLQNLKSIIDNLYEEDFEACESFNNSIDRIINYKNLYNSYYVKQRGGDESNLFLLQCFVAGIRKKKLENLNLVGSKLQELFRKNGVTDYSADEIYNYVKERIAPKYPEEFGDDFDDENPNAPFYGFKRFISINNENDLKKDVNEERTANTEVSLDNLGKKRNREFSEEDCKDVIPNKKKKTEQDS